MTDSQRKQGIKKMSAESKSEGGHMEGPVIRVKGSDGHHRKLLGKGDRGRGKRGRGPFCFLNGRSRGER